LQEEKRKKMISDLSAGDRLSLKGKLFELQKKLTIMDLEQRLDNQYPYQPQIKSYDLPNRPRDFIQNNAKAEIIRQQKKKLLQDSITAQTEESCTFSPKIYTSAEKFAHLDNRPVSRKDFFLQVSGQFIVNYMFSIRFMSD
jgi:hypothetical protein